MMNDDKAITQTMREYNELLYIMPYNAQHIGDREEQQDYFAYSNLLDPVEVSRSGNAAALADGMGGMEDGQTAAIYGVNAFLSAYLACDASSDAELENGMLDALYAANAEVCRLSGAGATLVAVVVKKNRLHWISVGDSHIYLVRNGVARLLSEDHVFAEELDRMYKEGEITYEQAMEHPERKALTSYLGLPNIERVSRNSGEFPLLKDDVILLCTDGLYRGLSDVEIAEITTEASRKKDDIAQELVDRVLEKHLENQDNVTVLALKMI